MRDISVVDCRPHKPNVDGSNPSPAPMEPWHNRLAHSPHKGLVLGSSPSGSTTEVYSSWLKRSVLKTERG